MNNQDRLLSDEELLAELMFGKKTYTGYTSGENFSVNGFLSRESAERLLDLINTQKRLYAESVNNTDKVTRFEVIDHRECVSCRGRMTANYLQDDGTYKEELCKVCDGSGMRGGRAFGAFSNPETSIIKVDLSFQDDDRTLKVFVTDRAEGAN